MKFIVKFAFGSLSIFLGGAILIWCLYCFFVPNRYFQWHLTDVPRLAIPVAMIWVGWYWIRGRPTERIQYSSELTITLKLLDSSFGSQAERDAILKLKHRLEDKLREMKLGEIDGEEFSGGECHIFVQTNSANQAMDLIRNLFDEEKRSYTIAESGL